MRPEAKDALTEVLADREKMEMRADVLAVTASHKQTRDKVMKARKASCCYGCKVGSSLGCYRKLGNADGQWIQAI